MNSEEFDVVVVGGGCAGLSAAIMLGRALRRVLVVDAGQPRNRFASHMHGVLGHEGIDPAALVDRGRGEAARYGVEFLETVVEDVSERDGHFQVSTRAKPLIARALIIATGLRDELPDIPGLCEHWGKRVLHCPYCHGWEVRNARLGVLASTPMASHQAQLVRQWSDDITFFRADGGTLDVEAEERLRARHTKIVHSRVTEVASEGDHLVVHTAEGNFQVDALFTAGRPRPQDGFLANLNLARAENLLGDFVEVDEMGRTSNPRVLAVGNVVNPGATVPVAMGAGALAGAMANMILVTEETDAAVSAMKSPDVSPTEFWKQHYEGADQVWSGRPNPSVTAALAKLTAGRAIDLGCGEGGDAIWLAQQGWNVTGVDISDTAIARARAAAGSQGLPETAIRFVSMDLAGWVPPDNIDLVSAAFFHSPVELDRTKILRKAARAVAVGGHLLIVSHASTPPGVNPDVDHHPQFLTSEEELAALDLPESDWDVVISQIRPRQVTWRDGKSITLEDSILMLQRVR